MELFSGFKNIVTTLLEKKDKGLVSKKYYKRELTDALSLNKNTLHLAKIQHKSALAKKKKINSQLSAIRYQKIGLNNTLRAQAKHGDKDESLVKQIDDLSQQQATLREELNSVDTRRKELWHETLPQTKNDLMIALEANKSTTNYINKEELATMFNEEITSEDKISTANLQNILQALSYDNIFAYIEYQETDDPNDRETLKLMIDTSKSEKSGLHDYLGEGVLQFESSISIPMRSITEYYGSEDINNNAELKSLINQLYKQYKSPNNQFYINRYQSAIAQGERRILQQVTNHTLSYASLQHLLDTGVTQKVESGSISKPTANKAVFLPKYTHRYQA